MGSYPEKIKTNIELWLNIFRLLKPNSINVIYQTIAPVSIFERVISENIQKPQDTYGKDKVDNKDISNYKLHLPKNEEEIFIEFIKNIKSTIKDISHTNYLTGSSYDLALHRYNDSFLKTEVTAYKILSSISSMEALLSDGGSEITFKIRLRVAKLLSFYGFNPIEVSDKMKDAYNLRSKLVHGAKTDDKEKNLLEFARKHTHEILNYNRICLLISLQLRPYLDKSKLMKEIDTSLIDIQTNEELKNLIIDKVKIPITNPFRKNDHDKI